MDFLASIPPPFPGVHFHFPGNQKAIDANPSLSSSGCIFSGAFPCDSTPSTLNWVYPAFFGAQPSEAFAPLLSPGVSSPRLDNFPPISPPSQEVNGVFPFSHRQYDLPALARPSSSSFTPTLIFRVTL